MLRSSTAAGYSLQGLSRRSGLLAEQATRTDAGEETPDTTHSRTAPAKEDAAGERITQTGAPGCQPWTARHLGTTMCGAEAMAEEDGEVGVAAVEVADAARYAFL